MRIPCKNSFVVAGCLVMAHAFCITVSSPVAAFSIPTVSLKADCRLEKRPVCFSLRAKEPTTGSSNEGGDVPSLDRQRRRVFSGTVKAIMATTLVPAATIGLRPTASQAAGYVPGTVWRTGKPPQVPGQKPPDKGDTKGTRKDAGFLRSIADCKAQCERSSGADGLARSKEDCLSECQDVCCETYEQCTFAIVPRI